ncbi:MAG TPA: glycoside hydrolase family 3 C-terminal domain-containing protein [Streptosporangiaceae bacterium]|nr:glycoside hydrolase family 3 C-terminal domain-containing protein [Streptosporangiaceae bacterium]
MTGLAAATETAIRDALDSLSLEDKVRLLAGQDMWSLPGIGEIGLASIVMSDGPVGVRGTHWTAADPSVALPSPTALAASWDPELAREAGRLLGQEARRKGVHVLLAPTVNLHRSPLGGRHFEAYSEDPLLTSAIGAGYVRGVQDHGVAATVKHYVANDFETERFTASTEVSERALRELYLAPFEALVREARAWAVMSAYNAVNGVPMTTNGALQLGVLRQEWGFDGVVVSDWMAAHDTVGTANGGLDVVMPARGSPWGSRLIAAVHDGEVPPEVIDEHVSRVLLLAARVGALAGVSEAVPPERRPAQADGAALAREIAVRSFVLASNRDRALPLDPPSLGTVALIGALGKDAMVLGGGSAAVFPAHVTSPLEGLAAALPAGVRLGYAVGNDPRAHLAPAASPAWTGLRVVFRDASGVALHGTSLTTGAGRWMDLPAGVDPGALTSVEIGGQLTAAIAGIHRLGIRGTGRFTLTAAGSVLFDGEVRADTTDFSRIFLAPPEHRVPLPLEAGEQADVTLVKHLSPGESGALVSLSLGYGEPAGTDDELLAEAEHLAAASDVAIVVVGTTEEVESEGFDRTSLTLPGCQDELVRRVAAAAPRTVVVVSAGSPVELPWADEVDAVLLTWFGGQELGLALADVLLGASEPGGRLPTTWPASAADCPVLNTTPTSGVLSYEEGIFIGYRAWERSAAVPRYPFGHGSGYTTWEYERIDVGDAEVRVTVRNTGARAGREVVQVYLSAEPADRTRPARWLGGFAIAKAAAGESVTVTVGLPKRAFQVWDGGWRTVGGQYLVEAAHNIADRRLSAAITIP